MKPVRSFSLRLWLPLWVICFVVIMWAVLTWYEYSYLKSNLIESSLSLVTQDMDYLQREMENELNSGNKTEAEQALTSRGVNPHYQMLVAIDDRGSIMYSTRFALKGSQAAGALVEFSAQQFVRLQLHNRADIHLKPGKQEIIAYFPLALGHQGHKIRSLRTGALFLVYDFNSDMALVWKALWYKSLLIALILLFAAVTFFVFIQYFFYRPVQYLISRTQALAKGDPGVRSSIYGKGELFYLSQAFNDMAARLEEKAVQRDQSEHEVRESEQCFRDLFNNAEVATYIEDMSAVYASMQVLRQKGVTNLKQHLNDNPDLARKLATSVKVLNVNNAVLTLFDASTEEDYLYGIKETFGKDTIAVFTEALYAIWDGKHVFSSPANFVSLSGKALSVIITFQIPRSETGFRSIPVSVIDITERELARDALKESERKYSALFEKSADAILLVEGSKFVDCNQATVDMLGYPDKKALLETHPSELSPELQPDGRSSFEKANEMMSIAFEKGSHRFEWVHTRKNGDNFPVEVLLTSIPFGERNFLHVVWRDISERQQTERALRRSQKMDAIGQLTGGIAHDFNNILSIILGNLSLLDHQLDADEKTQKRLDAINHSVQRAANLTRQLLGFSRSTAATVQAVNMNHVIKNLHELITQSLTPEVEVEQHFSEDVWLTEIDPGDFEDALINLTINARDAMRGRGKLTIETGNCTLDDAYCRLNPGSVPGDYVQLVVSDTGAGIPVELQDRIFEPFFTTKKQGKGTGLGLAMVFGFVKRSGGTIKVYSEPDIGTTFRLYLPRANDDEQQHKKGDKQNAVLPRGQETILLVDDELALLELVEETLKGLGYRVLTASNGRQALDVFAREPNIDLLFSDVVMPGGLNGFELAEQLVAECPQLKVLLTSGYTEKAVARNGQARFKANMLNKPFTQTELARRVREMLGTEKVYNKD